MKLFTRLIIFTLFLLGSLLAGYLWLTIQFQAVSPNSAPITFVIVPGQPASTTIFNLKAAHLIKSIFATKIYLHWTGMDQQLRPGSYVLSQSLDLKSLLAALKRGPVDVWVTLPEGWRREQIAARIDSVLTDPTKVFSPAEFITATAGLEGQLFPDSYLLPKDVSTSDVIGILTRNFAQKSGLSLPRDRDTLILASLLEREARSDSDRAIIAGIIVKRLAAGWPLQIDAAIQYAQNQAPNWWAPVTNTKLPSTYNTYLHAGLPPAPISNPGLAAITAVLRPKPSAYWYYLHDAKGEAHYSVTLLQHQANIDKYLRL